MRYAPRKHGYHGGASPQETLAPLLVLAPGLTEPIAVWRQAPYDPPDWWTGQAAELEPAMIAPHAAVEEDGSATP